MKELSVFFFIISVLGILGCQSLPKHVDKSASWALPQADDSPIAKRIENKLKQHPGLSGFHPLASGDDAFVARIASIRAAQYSLDLQYYIWNDDLTGKLMSEEVLKAADRGVRVRVLLDDLNLGQYEHGLRILAVHPHIQIRMTNPFANRNFRFFDITRLSEVDRRMHNKVFIADNHTAIVGGRNIGNEYFWASHDVNFGDMDLWAIGPVVPELSKEFDTYWNSDIAYPIQSLTKDFNPDMRDLGKLRLRMAAANADAVNSPYAVGLKNTELIQNFTDGNLAIYWGQATAVFDPPEKFKQTADEQHNNLHRQIRPYLDAAKKEILMVSPYFVPGDHGVDFLTGKVKSGIRVIILTNSLASSDVSSVFSGYKGYRKKLIQGGVELYELRPKLDKEMRKKKSLGSSGSHAGLHGKTFVFDRNMIFVGSMNLDPRSAVLNSEMGVMVDCPEMASLFMERFLKNLPEIAYKLSLNQDGDLRWTSIEDQTEVVFTKEPDTSWWQRVKASTMSVFIPESEL